MARAAASAGLSGLWLAETGHDPFLGALVASQSAPSLEVGTGIAVGLARSPMTLAQTAWDLAALTGGKFHLGLGSQVKAHVTRRFSMPWQQPVAQMRELVGAVRAIWAAFDSGEALRFEGEHYRLNLLTPFFTPAPHGTGAIPVGLAAVGPHMTQLAGEVADFVVLHAFTHPAYLQEVTFPALRRGAELAARPFASVQRVGALFVITGDAGQQEAMRQAVRKQLAFYASTPAYGGVLACLGQEKLHQRLHAMSRRGEWEQMAEALPDEVVDQFSLTAPPHQLEAAVRARFEKHYDRVILQLAPAELTTWAEGSKRT